MDKKRTGCSRRQFLKAAGAASVGSLLASRIQASQPAQTPVVAKAGEIKVSKRPFGKSGYQVSILSMGGMFDLAANQLMLKQAMQWGVTYWDTADCYHQGSESGIGKYFTKYPQDREKVFLVSKSDARDPEGITRLLDRSLERLHTGYIDLYFIHGIRSINELNDDTRRWAERVKAQKKIRLFGFSTHSNMEQCLLGAAKLGWVDGIMMTYNFRNMHETKMKEAVDACVSAGIGLTAMKTQASSSWFSASSSDDLKKHFMTKGFTEEQAKLKIVWQNPQIASICSQMDTMKLLRTNAEAATDQNPLSSEDVRLLQQYAARTADYYCTGCGDICDAAVGGCVPVSDIMRYHMYCHSYGRPEWAREHFNRLPAATRQAMFGTDYAEAQRRCPRKMPIARLMREAVEGFGDVVD